jgi:putative ABC transport system permease protein
MLKNFFVTAFRNLTRNRVFSFINIIGLSLGLACCLLIFLYAKDELSFDHFQQNSRNLYRITCQITETSHKHDRQFGISGMTEGPSFKKAIPQIRAYVRTNEADFVLRRGTELFQQKATWVDDNFFTVFSFPLISGNPATVLSDPYSIVLTDEMAKKYFGTADAVGKTLELKMDNNKFQTFTVSGIAKRAPANSSIGFDMLIPFKLLEETSPMNGWLFLSYSTFLQLQPGADPRQIASRMQQVYWTLSADQRKEANKHGFEGTTFTWGLQPFLQMHLDTSIQDAGINHRSDPQYTYILMGIALFLLGIACINFINLTIARSLKRSKEIGLRKVVGGSRPQLIRQFLGESMLLSGIAFLLALVLAQLVLPLFNELANKRLSLSYLLDAPLVISFIGLYLLCGFTAGFYPALVLSRFKPVDTLYARATRLTGRNYLGRSLVVLQFSLATFLIITTVFFYSQYDFLTHTSMGYDDNNLVVVTTGLGDSTSLMDAFRNEFARIPGVTRVGMTTDDRWGTGSRANGSEIDVRMMRIDEGYLPTMGVRIVAGRNFSPAFPSDSMHSVLVNEAYVAAAGWKDPIGKTVTYLNGSDTNLTVVGVVKDYHYENLKEKIAPEIFMIGPGMSWGAFALRLDPAASAQSLKAIEAVYHRLNPFRPFEHYFVAEKNREGYDQEARWRQIITCSAILAIFISCIGLFGLALLGIRQRVKEIGVRKVLGAGIWRIAMLVSRSFIGLVFLSVLIAIPLAWYVVGRWLDNFPYRVSMSPWVFLAAVLLTLFIAAFTVGIQALGAARANPVKSLRTE